MFFRRLCTVIAVLLLMQCPVLLFGQAKVGYVDSNTLLTKFTSAADAKAKLEDQNTQWAQEMARMNEELRKLQDELDKQSLLLSEAKKAEKADEIKALYTEIQKFKDQKWGQNGEYFRKQTELMQPVLDKINEIIQRIGEDEKFDYILDTAQGSVLYAQIDHDLTERILAELERGETKTATPSR